MNVLLLAWLAVSGNGSDAASARDECTVEVQELQRRITVRRLSLGDWRSFRKVAKMREKRGLEALPGLIGCPNLTNAAAELESDAATRSLLRRKGMSAKDYIETGWTLVVAYDPETFPVAASSVATANIAFVAQHRAEIESLLRDP